MTRRDLTNMNKQLRCRVLATLISILCLSEALMAEELQAQALPQSTHTNLEGASKPNRSSANTIISQAQLIQKREAEVQVVISEVVIKGANTELEELINKGIRTRPKAVITHSDIQKDINGIFSTGYFSGVKAERIDTQHGIRVIFVVQQNPLLRRIQIQARTKTEDTLIPPDAIIQGAFKNQYGKVINFNDLKKGIQALNQWYSENGFGNPSDTRLSSKLAEIARLVVSGKVISYPLLKEMTEGKYIQYIGDRPKIANNGILTLSIEEATTATTDFTDLFEPQETLYSSNILQDVVINFRTNNVNNRDKRLAYGKISSAQLFQQSELSIGKSIDIDELKKSVDKILSIDLFDDVKVSLKRGTAPDNIILILDVIENDEVAKYKQKIEIYQSKDEHLLEALIWQYLASFYEKKGKLDLAANSYRKAYRIYQENHSLAKNIDISEKLIKIYYDLAKKYEKENRNRKSIEVYENVLDIYKSQNNLTSQSRLLLKVGNMYHSEGLYKKGIKKYQEALEIARDNKELKQEAILLENLGNSYESLNEYNQANDFYKKALTAFIKLNDPLLQVLSLNNLSIVQRSLKNDGIALEYTNQSLSTLEKLIAKSSDRSVIQKCTSFEKTDNTFSLSISSEQNITFANVSVQLGDYQITTCSFPSSYLALLRGLILLNKSGIYQLSGNHQQALYAMREGLSFIDLPRLFSQVNEKIFPFLKEFENIPVLLLLQQLHLALAGQPQTIELNKRIEKIINPIESRLEVTAQSLERVKEDDSKTKNEEHSAIFYKKLGASALLRSISLYLENLYEESTLDEIYSVNNPYISVLEELLKKDEDQKSIPQSKINLADSLARMKTEKGDYLAKVGKTQEAIDSYKAVQELWNSIEKSGLCAVSENYTWSFKAQRDEFILDSTATQEDPSLASDLSSQSAKGDKSCNYSKIQQAKALNSIGKALNESGQTKDALIIYNEALSFSQVAKDKSTEAEIFYHIGNITAKSKDYQKAIEFYRKALNLVPPNGAVLQADIHLAIATSERDSGNFVQARSEIEEGIFIFESARSQINKQQKKQTPGQGNSYLYPSENSPTYKSYLNLANYLSSKQNYYDFYIDLLMLIHKQNPTAGYDILAFQASEQSHARSLRTMISRVARRPQEFAKLSASTAIEIAQVPPLQEIQQNLLDENTMLLEYALGEEQSYLWAVTKHGINTYQLPKRSEIEKSSKNFIKLISLPPNPESISYDSGVARQLSQMLLSQVADKLGNKRLVIVSDGILQYLPFAALPMPGTLAKDNVPLIIEHEIVGLPSASTLIALRKNRSERKTPPKTLAMFADPVFSREDERFKALRKPPLNDSLLDIGPIFDRLPGTLEEAKQILSLAPPRKQLTKLNFAADYQTATSPEMAQYRILHFATHGTLDVRHPERSGIVLSFANDRGELQRSVLSTPSVFNLNLNSELVVLSGCSTALGKEIKGEGLIGLTGGFMYAGSKSVVSSLWQIDDAGTASVMKNFYVKMLKEGLAPSTSLRAAQLEAWRSEKWHAPYYWAAFIHQGEWK